MKHNLDGCPIIVTEDVFEYRKSIAQYVTSQDVAIEVGCAEGLTTALIAQTAKQAFGIDKSPSQAAKAMQRHQHITNLTFHQVDAWDISTVLRLADEFGVKFTVIFIDVSGNRKVGDVESLLNKYEQVFSPRMFIVKSYYLKRLVNRCSLFSPMRGGQQQAAAGVDEESEAATVDVSAQEELVSEQPETLGALEAHVEHGAAAAGTTVDQTGGLPTSTAM